MEAISPLRPRKNDSPIVTNDAAIGAASPNVTLPHTDGKSAKKPRKTNSKGPKPSFLAKLYEHRRRFSGLERSRLEFASNAKYEVPDAAGGTMMLSSCELTVLNEKVREKLVEKVRIQLGVPADEAIDLSDFGLLVSDCPIANAHKHVAGELAEMQIGIELKLSGAAIMLAVLVIASYVHQRAGSTRFAKNLSELLERAVTRNDINKYLIAANDSRQSTEERVQTVINRLNSERAPFSLVNKMNKELFSVCVEITNRAGPVPLVAAHLKSLYEKNSEFEDLPNVLDILASWYSHFQKLELPDAYMYKREYLYCLMSMIIQNANPIQQLPPVSPGPQLEDQE